MSRRSRGALHETRKSLATAKSCLLRLNSRAPRPESAISSPQRCLEGMNTSLIAIRLLSVAEPTANAAVAQTTPAGGAGKAARTRANICGNCTLVPPAVRALHARTRARRLPARARRLRPPRPPRLLVLPPARPPARPLTLHNCPPRAQSTAQKLECCHDPTLRPVIGVLPPAVDLWSRLRAAGDAPPPPARPPARPELRPRSPHRLTAPSTRRRPRASRRPPPRRV